MINCQQILGYSWKVIATSIALLLLTAVEIAISFFLSSNTLKGNYKENNICYRFLSKGIQSASDNFNGDMEKFIKWRSNFEEKVESDIKYYCDKIGIPSFVFALLQIFSFFGVVVGFVFVIKNPAEHGNNSYFENGPN